MKIDFEAGRVIPAVIQDSETLEILMVGFMNEKRWPRRGPRATPPSGAARATSSG